MGRSNFGAKGHPLWSTGTFCHQLCKNGWTDRSAVWAVDLGRTKKHKFNRIRKVVLMCLTILCHELCKNGWTDRFAVWAVDLGGPKEARVQSHLPGGAPHGQHVDTSRQIRFNQLSVVVMWLMSNYFRKWYFPPVWMEIKCSNSLFSVRENLHVSFSFHPQKT